MSLALEWENREPPLAPVGMVAFGSDAALLSERLARLDASVTKHLRGVRGKTLLALLGPHDWLPWSPGVIYLAPDPTVSALFLPTTQRPTVSPALVLAALTQCFPELRPPLALLPTCCFSLAEASLPQPLPSPETQLRWGEGRGARGVGMVASPPLLPRNVDKEGEGVAQ